MASQPIESGSENFRVGLIIETNQKGIPYKKGGRPHIARWPHHQRGDLFGFGAFLSKIQPGDPFAFGRDKLFSLGSKFQSLGRAFADFGGVFGFDKFVCYFPKEPLGFLHGRSATAQISKINFGHDDLQKQVKPLIEYRYLRNPDPQLEKFSPPPNLSPRRLIP
jgi:hypothetical protein